MFIRTFLFSSKFPIRLQSFGFLSTVIIHSKHCATVRPPIFSRKALTTGGRQRPRWCSRVTVSPTRKRALMGRWRSQSRLAHKQNKKLMKKFEETLENNCHLIAAIASLEATIVRSFGASSSPPAPTTPIEAQSTWSRPNIQLLSKDKTIQYSNILCNNRRRMPVVKRHFNEVCLMCEAIS